MAIVNPFKALRPQPQFAPKVASRPYDVLSSLEAKIEARGNPHSFLHITKSEIDLPDKTDVHSQEVYDRAKQNLNAFIQRGVLFREDKSCFYIYQLIMDGRSQTGLVGVSAIDDYEKDVIKKHEFTRPEKEQDRINHIKTTRAQTGNVFLAYRNVEEIDEVINKWKSTHDPVYDFIAEDGVSHAIWVINSDQVNNTINKLFKEKVPATYIADGHHRAASAAKVRLQVEENYFLTTLFPAKELKILDYNRVVKDLNGMNALQLIEKLNNEFYVTESSEAVAPSKLHELGMYLKNKWYKLVAKPGSYDDDPIGVLDVTILSNNILDKLLGITDQRTDKRIDFIGGIRGLTELEKRVNSGEMAVAFSLYPVSIEQLFDISDSGDVMPPKSTWFEPKLRDGLLTHLTSE
ncbi:MAG TPA: DUF1015 family protein [Flavitalea sp.]|nr:DUF1015 family protein [Flavitalea sp.]